MHSEKSERIVDLAASLAAKADELDQVLIIYRCKEDGGKQEHGSMDNELEVRDALWLLKMFETWLCLGTVGVLPENEKD